VCLCVSLCVSVCVPCVLSLRSLSPCISRAACACPSPLYHPALIYLSLFHFSLSLSLPHLRSTQKRFVTQCFFCNACAIYFRFLSLHHTAHTKMFGKLAAKLKIYSWCKRRSQESRVPDKTIIMNVFYR